MSRIITIGVVVISFLIFIAGVIYWFEAEKEVRILCSMFRAGQSVEHVQNTLDTGNFLHYTTNYEEMVVNSAYTLNSTECIITISEAEIVTSAGYRTSFKLERIAALTGTVLSFLLAGFHLILVLGLPYGEMAWGGQHKKLPTLRRMGSLISFLLLIFGALSLLSSTDLFTPIPEHIIRYIIPIFTLLFFASVIGNTISESKKEKRVMIPVSYVLTGTYMIVCIYLFG